MDGDVLGVKVGDLRLSKVIPVLEHQGVTVTLEKQ